MGVGIFKLSKHAKAQGTMCVCTNMHHTQIILQVRLRRVQTVSLSIHVCLTLINQNIRHISAKCLCEGKTPQTAHGAVYMRHLLINNVTAQNMLHVLTVPPRQQRVWYSHESSSETIVKLTMVAQDNIISQPLVLLETGLK